MIGIYSIRNRKNGKVYIGSTSTSFEQRWNEHKSHFSKNRHGNIIMQRAWNKYGADAFEFRILEVVEHAEDLIRIEQFYIDVFFGENCYNLRPIANSNRGFKFSEESRQKMSKRMKEVNKVGGKVATERSKRMQGVFPSHFDKNQMRNRSLKVWHGFISPDNITYSDISDLAVFAKTHGVNAQGLRRVGRKERKSYKGWRVKP